MAKTRGAQKLGVAPLPEEGFLREGSISLSLTERQQLRGFFASDLWKKVWHNAQLGAPSVIAPGLDGPLAGTIASNRLHQMQGWELFKAALASQIEERVLRPGRPPDNYAKPLEIEPAKK